MSSPKSCCCPPLTTEILSLGRLLSPLLCPWLPLDTVKQDQAGERAREGRILEETEDIRKQKTDHCKYKYIMLRNGIKVEQGTVQTVNFFLPVFYLTSLIPNCE